MHEKKIHFMITLKLVLEKFSKIQFPMPTWVEKNFPKYLILNFGMRTSIRLILRGSEKFVQKLPTRLFHSIL